MFSCLGFFCIELTLKTKILPRQDEKQLSFSFLGVVTCHVGLQDTQPALYMNFLSLGDLSPCSVVFLQLNSSSPHREQLGQVSVHCRFKACFLHLTGDASDFDSPHHLPCNLWGEGFHAVVSYSIKQLINYKLLSICYTGIFKLFILQTKKSLLPTDRLRNTYPVPDTWNKYLFLIYFRTAAVLDNILANSWIFLANCIFPVIFKYLCSLLCFLQVFSITNNLQITSLLVSCLSTSHKKIIQKLKWLTPHKVSILLVITVTTSVFSSQTRKMPQSFNSIIIKTGSALMCRSLLHQRQSP